MRRVTKLAIVGVTVAAVGAGGIAYASSRDESASGAQSKPATQLATVKVAKQDLVTYNETTATLGFTTSVTVSSPVQGTVTQIVKAGDNVDAGTVAATVDGEPVVALIGDVPGYRDLSRSSSDGVDVHQLEQNLVMLGFDPDGAINIDDHYDKATANAVTAWEESLGLVGDGKVLQGRVVYIPGRLLVDDVNASIGSGVAAGGPLFTGRQAQRKFLVSATVGDGGAIGNFPTPGTVVSTGTVIFWENYVPVVAIEADPAALPALGRDLRVGVSDGADVKLLEQTLKAGGFDPNAAMTVDDHFDDATAAAVTAWRGSLGLPPSDPVVVPKGGFVVVPSGLTVSDPLVPVGPLASQAPVLALTSPSREVTTTAPIDDATFAVGAHIDVEFPDGTIEPGTVVTVGNVATNTSNNPGDTPSVPITIHVDTIPKSVDSFVEIPVTLRAVDESVRGAFVVPVSALLALSEGGYALQVVDGQNPDGTAATHLIGVTTGLFADGFVEVKGNDLKEGLDVVVPS